MQILLCQSWTARESEASQHCLLLYCKHTNSSYAVGGLCCSHLQTWVSEPSPQQPFLTPHNPPLPCALLCSFPGSTPCQERHVFSATVTGVPTAAGEKVVEGEQIRVSKRFLPVMIGHGVGGGGRHAGRLRAAFWVETHRALHAPTA